MTHVTVAVYPTPAQSGAVIDLRRVVTAGNSAGPAPRNMPPSISRSQRYYWTAKWQSEEAESVAEISAGRVERFTSGRDAIAWLLSADEDEHDA